MIKKLLRIFKIIIFIIIFFATTKCMAQTPELPSILADRPGMGTPPFIAEKHSFQIETGFSYEKNELDMPQQEKFSL